MAVKCSNCGTDHDDWIPKERLDQVTEQRRVEKQRADAAEAKLTEQAPALAEVEQLRTKVGEMEAELGKSGLELAIVRGGIREDEGVGIARMVWDSLPEDKRPEGGISAWLEDRAALPKAVRAYLEDGAGAGDAAAGGSEGASGAGAGDQAGAASGGDGTQAGQKLPRTNTGTDPRSGAPAGAKFTAEQINAMTPEEFAANEAAIMAQIRPG